MKIGKKAGVAVWCCPCLLNRRLVSHSSLPRIPHVKQIKELCIQRVQIGGPVSSTTVRCHSGSSAASAHKSTPQLSFTLSAHSLIKHVYNDFNVRTHSYTQNATFLFQWRLENYVPWLYKEVEVQGWNT